MSVADTLRNRIFDGVIAPGSHLMEISLANELGVSRTPVRGAMARLADEGLLVYLPNKGFQVRRFNAKDVFDAFSVRATLEGMGWTTRRWSGWWPCSPSSTKCCAPKAGATSAPYAGTT